MLAGAMSGEEIEERVSEDSLLSTDLQVPFDQFIAFSKLNKRSPWRTVFSLPLMLHLSLFIGNTILFAANLRYALDTTELFMTPSMFGK